MSVPIVWKWFALRLEMKVDAKPDHVLNGRLAVQENGMSLVIDEWHQLRATSARLALEHFTGIGPETATVFAGGNHVMGKENELLAKQSGPVSI